MAKELSVLQQQAEAIKTEVNKGANTSSRIGGMFGDMLEYNEEKLTELSKQLRPKVLFQRFLSTIGRLEIYEHAFCTEFVNIPQNGDILEGIYFSDNIESFYTMAVFDSSYNYIKGINISLSLSTPNKNYIWNEAEINLPDNAAYLIFNKNKDSSTDIWPSINIYSPKNILTGYTIEDRDKDRIVNTNFLFTKGYFIDKNGNYTPYQLSLLSQYYLIPTENITITGIWNYPSKGWYGINFFSKDFTFLGVLEGIEEGENVNFNWDIDLVEKPLDAAYIVIQSQYSQNFSINIDNTKKTGIFPSPLTEEKIKKTNELLKITSNQSDVITSKSINLINIPYNNEKLNRDEVESIITSGLNADIKSTEFIEPSITNLKNIITVASIKTGYTTANIYKLRAEDIVGWDKESSINLNFFLGGYYFNNEDNVKNGIQVFVTLYYGASIDGVNDYNITTTDKKIFYQNDGENPFHGPAIENNPSLNFKRTIISVNRKDDDNGYSVVFNMVIHPYILDSGGNKLYFSGICYTPTTKDEKDNVNKYFSFIDYPVVVTGQDINLNYLPPSFFNSKNEKGATWSTLLDDNNKIKSELLPNSNGGVRYLTVQNSDKIAFYGCSYTESYYAIKKKSWINKLSNMLDIQLANFGVSGNRIVDICKRMRDNSNPYHSTIGIKEIKPTYIAIQNIGNETLNTEGNNLDFYLGEVEEAAELVKSYGAQLMLGTDWIIGNPSVDALLRDYADQNGYLYWGVGTISEKILANKYAGFWGGGHPATRTNATIWQEYLNFMRNLGVRQCIKVYRVRDEFKGGSPTIQDLNYDTIPHRMVKWNEINVGEVHLSETEPGWDYYDRLNETAAGGGWAYQATRANNEYCNLIAKQNVSFNNWGLIEFILPVVKTDLVKVYIKSDDDDLKFYVKQSADKSYQYGTERNYCMFKVDKSVYDNFETVVEDTQYKSSNTGDAILQYKGRLKGYDYPGYYLCFYNSTNSTNASGGTGTLTSVSGGGEISYISASSGLGKHSYGFFDSCLKPLANFEEITSVYNATTGYYEIDITDYKYMQYDKLRVIVGKTGVFNISDVYCSAEGGIEKRINKNIFKPLKQQGTELMTDTGMGVTYNEQWELTDGAAFGTIPDAINQYPGFHSDYKSFIKLGYDSENFPGIMRKVFTVDEARGYRDIIIRVTARLFPKVYNSTKTPDEIYTNVRQITSSSYDLATLCVGIKMGDKTPSVSKRLVDIGWAELEVRTCIPPFVSNIEVSMWRDDKDLDNSDYESCNCPLQVCDVSVQIVE